MAGWVPQARGGGGPEAEGRPLSPLPFCSLRVLFQTWGRAEGWKGVSSPGEGRAKGMSVKIGSCICLSFCPSLLSGVGRVVLFPFPGGELSQPPQHSEPFIWGSPSTPQTMDCHYLWLLEEGQELGGSNRGHLGRGKRVT